MAAWISGALAGSIHAVSGPDHLAALIPMCMGKGMEAYKEGAVWGLGHGMGCSLMGLFGVVFKQFIDIHIVSEYMEYVVGFTLILLGYLGIKRSQKWKKQQSLQLHMIGGDIENQKQKKKRHVHISLDYSSLGTIWVTGIIHGFSGTGHILGVIPALSHKHISNGIKYLSAFCVGTAVSMSVFTTFVGMIGDLITNTLKKQKNGRLSKENIPAIISFYASAFSVFVGVVWIIQPLIARNKY